MTLSRKPAVFVLAAAIVALVWSSRVHAVQAPQVVKITASKFHYEPDHIALKKGQPVTLQITSLDTTHGFMLRPLKIDTDIRAGTSTVVTVLPAGAGTFTAICDHYCGLGHGGMKLTMSVVD
jgi:cytochrome c oxidase subunit 2